VGKRVWKKGGQRGVNKKAARSYQKGALQESSSYVFLSSVEKEGDLRKESENQRFSSPPKESLIERSLKA